MFYDLYEGRTSDHSTLLVRQHPIDQLRWTFRLMNLTLGSAGFAKIVLQNRSANIVGTTMFHFNSKLCSIKVVNKQCLTSQPSLKD